MARSCGHDKTGDGCPQHDGRDLVDPFTSVRSARFTRSSPVTYRPSHPSKGTRDVAGRAPVSNSCARKASATALVSNVPAFSTACAQTWITPRRRETEVGNPRWNFGRELGCLGTARRWRALISVPSEAGPAIRPKSSLLIHHRRPSGVRSRARALTDDQCRFLLVAAEVQDLDAHRPASSGRRPSSRPCPARSLRIWPPRCRAR